MQADAFVQQTPPTSRGASDRPEVCFDQTASLVLSGRWKTNPFEVMSQAQKGRTSQLGNQCHLSVLRCPAAWQRIIEEATATLSDSTEEEIGIVI
jgi:hypothetical protein